MSKNNENEPISMSCYLGNLASTLTVPVVHFPKKTQLVSAKLLNGAAIAASDTSFVTLQLLNGMTPVATLDTRLANQGAVIANVAKNFALLVSSLDPLTDLSLSYVDQEGLPEITRIATVADVSGSLDQKSFTIYDEVGSVGVWIDLNNAGGSAPVGAAAKARQIAIHTINTGDSAATVATKIAAALEADSKFSALVDPSHTSQVVVTSSTSGTRTDASNAAGGESPGFTISVDQQGVAAVSEALTNAQLVLDFFPL